MEMVFKLLNILFKEKDKNLNNNNSSWYKNILFNSIFFFLYRKEKTKISFLEKKKERFQKLDIFQIEFFILIFDLFHLLIFSYNIS